MFARLAFEEGKRVRGRVAEEDLGKDSADGLESHFGDREVLGEEQREEIGGEEADGGEMRRREAEEESAVVGRVFEESVVLGRREVGGDGGGVGREDGGRKIAQPGLETAGNQMDVGAKQHIGGAARSSQGSQRLLQRIARHRQPKQPFRRPLVL